MVMSRVVFVSTDNYLGEVEEIGDEFHMHLQVFNWNKAVAKQLYRELAKVKLLAKSLGHDKIYSVSPNPQFCKMYCGESLGSYNNCEVMVWESQ